ncbi:ComF family protein [Mammaliicoccus vitulinus]|nr:phosphoribosyltransferase family protein [Mammaliicoccus vitulinus]HAL08471.1 ComF family protein [Staphylococcus sp.]PNZ35191.1 hypothetical protein CD107_11530 [Mammaliicoccus vitulinus]PTI38198.1 ComF family protein [Mammaliicoccus vitulinus]PTI72827.1 ComF family protein [Mammaliicoccus vitulinus]PTI90643.1 ComF family protein [Mammaliicoccus vitulinus]
MKRCMICQNPIIEVVDLLNFFSPISDVCKDCELKLTFNHAARRCPRCLKILSDEEQECLDCVWLSKNYTLINQLYTIYDYQGLAKDLIQQYKLVGDVAIAQIFQLPRSIMKQYDYVIPAPIHPNKLAKRTFDHVTFVLDSQNIKYTQIFETEERLKQSDLSKRARALQHNPFKIKRDLELENKKILLVDDIYTTGLTIHRLAELLIVRKIRKIDALTFARG